MTRLLTRTILPAALLTCASDAALGGGAPHHIRILCDQTTAYAICDGLRDGLATRFPDHTVTVSPTPAPETATVVHLIAHQPRADEASGYLAWTTPDGNSGKSRALSLSVMDAPLDAAMQRDFGLSLAALFQPLQ